MTCLDANGNPKGTYENRTVAERFRKARLRDNPTLYLRVYRCPDCGLFHLTSKPDRKESAA